MLASEITQTGAKVHDLLANEATERYDSIHALLLHKDTPAIYLNAKTALYTMLSLLCKTIGNQADGCSKHVVQSVISMHVHDVAQSRMQLFCSALLCATRLLSYYLVITRVFYLLIPSLNCAGRKELGLSGSWIRLHHLQVCESFNVNHSLFYSNNT